MLAESDQELLDKVGFDFTILEQIPDMVSKLANLLAKATADQSESPILRIARDKGDTVLRNLLDELVRYGRLVTLNTPQTPGAVQYHLPSG
jgi:F0F1-type ATP synthase delta subunit